MWDFCCTLASKIMMQASCGNEHYLHRFARARACARGLRLD